MADTILILDALFAAEAYFTAEATRDAVKHRSQKLVPSPILETIKKALAELGVKRGSDYMNLPPMLTIDEYIKERYGKDVSSN